MTFTIKPNGFDEVKKQLRRRAVPIFILILAFLVYSNYPTADSNKTLTSFLITVILLPGILVFAWYRSMKTQRELFESFQITITGDTIIRDRKNTPTIRIERAEIKEITKGVNGSLAIKGTTRQDVIFIPAQIENRHQLEELLATFSPIKVLTKKRFLDKYGMALPFLALGLMLVVSAVRNKYVVAAAGTLLIGFMIWAMVEIQISKNYDKRIKDTNYWLIVVILVLVAIILSRFTQKELHFNP